MANVGPKGQMWAQMANVGPKGQMWAQMANVGPKGQMWAQKVQKHSHYAGKKMKAVAY